MRREQALEILGLGTADAKDFAAVRSAYHRRMRAVHPDLNSAPYAPEAAAMVSAAYDFLERAYRSQKQARAVRDTARARSEGGSARATGSGPKARVLSDTTVTAYGTVAEVFELALGAAEHMGEVSSIDRSSGMIGLVAEFLHMAPCQVTLTVVRRGEDRAHIRCSVEAMSRGEAPPVAAVTRLLAKQLADADRCSAAGATSPGVPR